MQTEFREALKYHSVTEKISSDLFPEVLFSKEYFQPSAKCEYINIYS